MSAKHKPHSTLKEKLAAAVIAQQGYYTENKVLKRRLRELEEQLEAAQDALTDAVWDGQRQGLQALREAISGRFPAPLVDDIFEEAHVILRASYPASSRSLPSMDEYPDYVPGSNQDSEPK